MAYVRFQMTQLLALVMLFVAATAFNINRGVALTPSMVLYLLFFVTVAGVVVIAVGPGDPDVVQRAAAGSEASHHQRTAVLFWVLYAVVLFLAALTPLVAGPDQPSPDRPSASMTMTFVVMGLGTVFSALTNRRNPASGLTPPILTALAISVVPVVPIVLATEVGFLQRSLLTQELTGYEWLACIGLALALPIVIEAGKWIHRSCAPYPRDRPDASGHTRTGPHRREQAIATATASPKPLVWARVSAEHVPDSVDREGSPVRSPRAGDPSILTCGWAQDAGGSSAGGTDGQPARTLSTIGLAACSTAPTEAAILPRLVERLS